MSKATARWMVCLAASFGLAATVLLAQSQSKRTVPNASATRSSVTPASTQLTPLNAKTGLWQTTTKLNYTGLSPQQAQMAAAINPTMTYKSCLKPKDLNPNQWTTKGFGLKCSSMTVTKSTGTDLQAQGKGCDVGDGMTADGSGNFHVSSDSEHVTGSIDVTFSGSTPFGNGPLHWTANYTSNWVGSTCPANMD